jgi:N-carbamoylputrescine amidase
MARSPALPVALIQMSCVADPARNVQTALSHVAQAARGGAKLVCLPELFRSLYFCQKQDYKCFQLAEPIPGPTTQLLSAAAKKHKITLVSSLFEKRTGGLYHNTAVVFGPNGKILGTYRKMHIPDDPGFNEKFYFTPGDTGFQPIDTPVGRLGILVCWDQWYPEAARLMALRGAQILIYPTAIGWARGEKKDVCQTQRNAWQTIQRSHAIANGLFVLSINRTGRENNLDFWGTSFVSNPMGHVVAEASTHRAEIVRASLQLSETTTTRQHWPFLRDRRVDAYTGLDQRFLRT